MTEKFTAPRTVRGALTRALKLIEPEGSWIQGSWEMHKADGSVCYCLDGAIVHACTGDGYADVEQLTSKSQANILKAAREALVKQIRKSGFVTQCREVSAKIYKFNDRPGRTQAEVLDVLRAAREAA